MSHVRWILTLAVLITLCGCTPWATYPPIKGAADISNPNLAPIPGLMAAAIRRAHTERGGEDEMVINLPAGASYKVYDKVLEKLEEGRPMTRVGEAAFHVAEVRIRTVDAEVDIIAPGSGGVPGLTTYKFKQNVLSGWTIEDKRFWRIHVAIPAPNYVPPPVEEIEDEEAAEEAPAAPAPEQPNDES